MRGDCVFVPRVFANVSQYFKEERERKCWSCLSVDLSSREICLPIDRVIEGGTLSSQAFCRPSKPYRCCRSFTAAAILQSAAKSIFPPLALQVLNFPVWRMLWWTARHGIGSVDIVIDATHHSTVCNLCTCHSTLELSLESWPAQTPALDCTFGQSCHHLHFSHELL